MFKLRVFRLGNSFLLGLIGLLAGCTLFVSHSAGADSQGTDCPADWSNLSAGCTGTEFFVPTGNNYCQTSPSGLCCTYQEYDVYCHVITDTHIGKTYVLSGPGQSGKSCTQMGCR